MTIATVLKVSPHREIVGRQQKTVEAPLMHVPGGTAEYSRLRYHVVCACLRESCIVFIGGSIDPISRSSPRAACKPTIFFTENLDGGPHTP